MPIGHSLGSLVAYEYLRQHPGHRVELLLTFGSPLGLRMVRSRSDVVALSVPAWVNVRDLRDPVVCAGPLRTWWPQLDPDGDRIVDNGADAHGVKGYLGRLLLIGMAAAPDPDGRTRVALTGGVRIPGRAALVPIGVERAARGAVDRLEAELR